MDTDSLRAENNAALSDKIVRYEQELREMPLHQLVCIMAGTIFIPGDYEHNENRPSIKWCWKASAELRIAAIRLSEMDERLRQVQPVTEPLRERLAEIRAELLDAVGCNAPGDHAECESDLDGVLAVLQKHGLLSAPPASEQAKVTDEMVRVGIEAFNKTFDGADREFDEHHPVAMHAALEAALSAEADATFERYERVKAAAAEMVKLKLLGTQVGGRLDQEAWAEYNRQCTETHRIGAAALAEVIGEEAVDALFFGPEGAGVIDRALGASEGEQP